jgi:ferritin-like metal-binding protein YciE
MDAAIIGALQRVEHYEIAVYGTLASFARQLDLGEAAELLEEILAEEKEADATLSDIAMHVNFNAEMDEADKAETPKHYQTKLD